ncbi:hypothetical protein WAF00_08035 [Mameliella alba]|uniref:hypothetical protein n=1 Tax=Mameliella alba TaxID=561184 RepID=UPI0015557BE6|nr:hypothetical protein [Mameliella alba]
MSRQENADAELKRAHPRLKNNLSLLRELVAGAKRSTEPILPDGSTACLPLKPEAILEYSNFLAVGLNFLKLGVRAKKSDCTASWFASDHGDLFLYSYFIFGNHNFIFGTMGNNTVQYMGTSATDGSELNIWRFTFLIGGCWADKAGCTGRSVWTLAGATPIVSDWASEWESHSFISNFGKLNS